jgi:hypothetical protein
MDAPYDGVMIADARFGKVALFASSLTLSLALAACSAPSGSSSVPSDSSRTTQGRPGPGPVHGPAPTPAPGPACVALTPQTNPNNVTLAANGQPTQAEITDNVQAFGCGEPDSIVDIQYMLVNLGGACGTSTAPVTAIAGLSIRAKSTVGISYKIPVPACPGLTGYFIYTSAVSFACTSDVPQCPRVLSTVSQSFETIPFGG